VLESIGDYLVWSSAIAIVIAAAMRIFNVAASWADEVLAIGLACLVIGVCYIWLASNAWAIYVCAVLVMAALAYRWRSRIGRWFVCS
jgi:chromate transport protein ChrA